MFSGPNNPLQNAHSPGMGMMQEGFGEPVAANELGGSSWNAFKFRLNYLTNKYYLILLIIFMPLPNKEDIETALEKETNKGILELTSSKIKQEKNDILQNSVIARAT